MSELEVKPVKIRAMAIVPGVNPFETLLLAACVLISAARLLGASSSSTLEANLPPWAVTLWYINLAIGSAIAIHGGLKGRKVTPGKEESTLLTGLLQYSVGWMYVGTASVTYGMLILLLFPEKGLISGLFTLSWGLASMTRPYQVSRHIRRLRSTREGRRHSDDS